MNEEAKAFGMNKIEFVLERDNRRCYLPRQVEGWSSVDVKENRS